MKTIPEILNILKDSAESVLPGLLSAEGLDDFDIYVIGDSRDETIKALCFYKADTRHDANENRASFIIHAQLANTDYELAENYGQVVYEWIRTFPPNELGFNIIDKIETETYPFDENRTTFILTYPEWIEFLDSCNEEN